MDTKKMAILAMMAALAYVVMLVGRVPIVLWLKYDPKDVVIAIAAFIYGPMAGVGISIVDSLIEMLTASDTGIWGSCSPPVRWSYPLHSSTTGTTQ